MGINDLLKSKEYYIAAMDEIEIEKDLSSRDQSRKPAAQIDSEQAAMRAALQEIDRLKIGGDYDTERARLFEEFGLAQYHSGRDLDFPARVFEFARHWRNLRDGLQSPNEAERVQFRNFYEVAQIESSGLPETLALTAVLQRVKKRQGRTLKLKPAWLEDTSELDEMRLMHAQGMTVPEAARQVAQKEGRAHQDGRAKRFENLFRKRMKLR